MSNHKSVDLLSKANSLITGVRGENYGPFKENVTDIQLLVGGMTGKTPSKQQVYAFIFAMKLCRHTEDGWSEDTLTDLAGYAALIHEDCNG